MFDIETANIDELKTKLESLNKLMIRLDKEEYSDYIDQLCLQTSEQKKEIAERIEEIGGTMSAGASIINTLEIT